MKAATISLTFLLCATAVAAPAAAQPAGAHAETLFRRGKELMARGSFAEACAAFDASQKLDPAISTQINRAYCREKNGQLATAWGLFLEAERATRVASDSRSKQLHGVASERAGKLEPRLSTLSITVAAEDRIAGLEILRDGELVDAASWNQPLPVDGGTYTITARAPVNAPWSTSVQVGAERDAKIVKIPRLELAALAQGPGAPADSSPGVDVAARRSQLVPILVGSAAAATLGGALAFHLWGNSTYDDATRASDPATQDSLWHSANTKRYVAEGLLAAGVVTGGVAVWLYLRNRGGSAGPAAASAGSTAWTVEPTPGAGQAGLQLSGRF